MSGFAIAWSDAQQERLEDLVADGRDLAEIMRRMPGHPRARLARKIAAIESKPEAAPRSADAACAPAGQGPGVREHAPAPARHEIPREERSGTAREAPGTFEGRDLSPPVVGAGVDVGVQPGAPPPKGAVRVEGSKAAPARVAMKIKLPPRALALLEAMATEAGRRPVVLAAELLVAVLEDDAAAHGDRVAAE